VAFFQYVLSFALQKLPLSALCFQYVLSFVFNVAFALLRDKKSPLILKVLQQGKTSKRLLAVPKM
jgi:hypothetical protein